MFISYLHQAKEQKQGIAGVFADIAECALFIKKHLLIRRLSLYFFLLTSLVGPIFTIVLPLMFKTVLAYGDSYYGAIQAVQMLGYMIGAITVGLISKKLAAVPTFKLGNFLLLSFLIPFCVIMFPFSYNTLGNSSTAYLSIYSLSLLLFSLAFAFLGIPVQTIIQQSTPPEYMSRIFSIVGLLSKGGMPLGAFFMGMILSDISIHWLMAGLTALLVPLILVSNFMIPSTVEK